MLLFFVFFLYIYIFISFSNKTKGQRRNDPKIIKYKSVQWIPENEKEGKLGETTFISYNKVYDLSKVREHKIDSSSKNNFDYLFHVSLGFAIVAYFAVASCLGLGYGYYNKSPLNCTIVVFIVSLGISLLFLSGQTSTDNLMKHKLQKELKSVWGKELDFVECYNETDFNEMFTKK